MTKGAAKLFAREPTLREWVAEGRDNYELARAFHVPIADVRTVIAALNLVRPYEEGVDLSPQPKVEKRCSFCRNRFQASRLRFRCDDCLHLHSTWSEEYFGIANGV